MRTIKINALVIRKDWQVIDAEWIEDWYTNIQIIPDIMNDLVNYGCDDMSWWDEARCFEWSYWPYELKIQEIEIDNL